MKTYSIILLLCCGLITKAQSNYLGIKAGYAYSLPKYASGSDYKARESFTSALTFEHKFKSKLTLGAELLYTQKGFTQRFRYIIMNNEPVYEKGSFNYNYLGVPVKVGFLGGNRFKLFVNAGFCAALLVGESRKYSDPSLANVKQDTRLLELSWLLDLGVGYELSEKITLNAILATQQCFAPVEKGKPVFKGDDLAMQTDMILLGVKYKLGSRQ